MADEKEQESPSADEGVEEEEAAQQEAEAQSSADEVGGIFDVSASKKRKKKKKKGGDKGKKKKKKKKKKSANADLGEVGGVLDPTASDVDPDDVDLDDDYLVEDDLDDYEGGGSNKTTVLLTVVVLALVGVIGFLIVGDSELGGDLEALFQGELKERRLAEANQKKKAWEREQEEKLEKYGTLNIMGSPKYALLELNGETQYGQTESGAWRELRLDQSTVFQNLKVKKDHLLEIDAPNFEPESIRLSEGQWDSGQGPLAYSKQLTIKLVPESTEKQLEFEQRMDTSDTENEYEGEVTITTEPEGATLIFDTEELVDENGDELTTPVTFDTYYVEDEDTGELEEKEINVDTPPDRGHKIELKHEDYPEYVTMLDRRMWNCEWTDGEVPESIDDSESYRDYCEYTFELDLDFDELKSYIEEREEEKKRVEENNKKLKAAQEEAAEEVGGEEAENMFE